MLSSPDPAPPSVSVLDPEYRRGRRPANYGQRFPPEVLTAAEVRLLMKHCGRGRAQVRNRALIATMWRAGLRVAEAVALAPVDLDWRNGVVFVRCGKGSKHGRVGIDHQALAIIGDWMRVRDEIPGATDTSPLFCTFFNDARIRQGTALHTSYVRSMLKRAAARAGIQRRVHPHALRHTLASELAFEGISLPLISAQLRHSSISHTDAYLHQLCPSHLIKAMNARPSWM